MRKLCSGSQGLVDDFKTYTTNIARACREMANLSLIHIEHKKLYGSAEFESVQTKHREMVVVTLERLASEIKTNLKSVYKLFLGDGAGESRVQASTVVQATVEWQQVLCYVH